MPKNVQIPYDLFLQLVRYHYLEDCSPELQTSIRKALEVKIEAMIRHEIYSEYKNKSLSPEEQEQARQRYLERIGMRNDFRWPAGWSPEPPHK